MEFKILFVALIDILAFAGAFTLQLTSCNYTGLTIMLVIVGLALTMLLDLLINMYDDMKKINKK